MTDPPPEGASLTDAQRWVMGAHAVLIRRNEMRLDTLGGMDRPGYSFVSARMMARDWGIFTAEEALERIDWLLERGHRDDLESESAKHAHTGYDLVRASGVAAWSWHAYFLELDDAWSRMVDIARQLQSTYRSWSEVAASYLRGYERMFGRDQELELLRDGIVPDLLTAADSPWLLPFELRLDAAIPAPKPRRSELLVDPANGSAFATIREALRAAKTGDIVRVAAGTYRERIDIVTPVEIEGVGEVDIENDEACCVFMKASSGSLSNLRFRSGTSAAGEAMHAVIVHAHFLRLADCVVRSARSGVYLTNDKAHVSLLRTRVENTASVGVLVEGGRLSMDECVVEGSGVANVQVGGESEARLVDCRLEGAAQTGLTIVEGARASAKRCTSRANLAGLDVTSGGHLEVEGGQVSDNQGGGIRIFGAASSIRVEGARIADNGSVNVGANEATDVAFYDCELSGGGLGAWADHGSRIVLEACRVGRGTEGLVREMNGGKVSLVRCHSDEQPEA